MWSIWRWSSGIGSHLSNNHSEERGWASVNFFTSVGALEVDVFECLAIALQCIVLVLVKTRQRAVLITPVCPMNSVENANN